MGLKGIIFFAVLVMLNGYIICPVRQQLKQKLDSLNAVMLKEYNKKISEISQQRVVDSMQQVKLEQGVEFLENY